MTEPLPTVIVPVFNAHLALDACLGSLERTLPARSAVYVADDASSDPRVADVLAAWQQRSALTVTVTRRQRNLGFPGNVNAALAATAPADVVIVNSDAIASSGWLQRIAACAASDRRIASITPWSNNAEIASFPRFCENNPVPDDADALAQAAATAGSPEYPDLPTTMGFCMYLRRAALNTCGDFDAATFGRGYGEENDLSRRFAAHGWRNVLCDDAYVVHTGNASFGPLGMAPGGDNLQRLTARWPDYNERIARFILSDPLAPLRARLQRQLDALARPRNQGDLFG
ncbi:MAG: glycosyltransferase [Lysobacterales bacterium CG17_big_fil_post_rev_8_21_14_2_50_64_11]|nr:MAG: glycosyltransferase [Xanthomonadales bacterium CG17_big_fil_post_rev_8_21_14_2_50_64_11]PIX60831.1 MAG: glycosyltransferase [Xanthomonadales bacterium CG_4_10_14_3_um_filter_64_11]